MTTNKNEPRPARSLMVTLATAFFTLSMVLLLANGTLAIYTNYTAYQETLSARQLLIAQEAGNIVAGSIQEKFSVLETAVEFGNPNTSDSKTKQSILESLLGLQPSFRQLAMLSTTGRQAAQISRQSSASSPQFEAQLTKDMLAQTKDGQRYISPVYIDDATSEPLVAIAVPAQNVFGDFQGVLVAELNLKFMWDLVDQLKVGETGYAYVVDNQGNLIAFEDTALVLRGENLKHISEVNEFVENPGEASDITPEVASYAGLLGDTVVGTYVPLGAPQWAVVVELPAAEANQPIIQSLAASIATILIFAVLAGVAGVFVARRLSAPLIELSKVATEVGAGNLALVAKVAGPAEIAKVAATFNTMTSRLRDLIGSLEQRVVDRTKALATSTEVSRRLSTILDRKELVTEVVDQVKNAFGYYHTQIYFYDEAHENLVMAGGTGEAGELMLAQFHKIAKGRGLVGRAAESNEPILVSDTTQNPEWLPNPLLPDTKSEVAIPISIGDRVLGVLDIQHNVTDGLKREDVDSLQSIANQVAVAIQNIQSTEIVAKRATELQTVAAISTATATISDIEKMLQTVVQLTQRRFDLYHAHIFSYDKNTKELKIVACGWEEGDPNEGLLHGDSPNIPIGKEDSLVARTARTRQAVLVNDVRNDPNWYPNPQLPETHSELAVPLIVGDQLLGVLDVQSDRVNAFSEEDANIQSTLASQVAVALQNARSFAQTQHQAERETTINLIAERIQSATSIEAALQITVRELGHALGMKSTLVTLEPEALAGEQK